jgi:hypothetical protein
MHPVDQSVSGSVPRGESPDLDLRPRKTQINIFLKKRSGEQNGMFTMGNGVVACKVLSFIFEAY